MQNTASLSSSSAEMYIKNGWRIVKIAHGTKGPQHKNWNTLDNILEQQPTISDNDGIGLAHAYSGTMAFDIDNLDMTIKMFKDIVDINTLLNAPDAVIIDSGRPSRSKLIYTMPEGIVLPTKKIVNKSYTICELRCGTSNGLTVQDVLPPSIHPLTSKPYQWAGKGDWHNPPQIPKELLDYWDTLIIKESERVIPTHTVNASWDEIQDALNAINPSCSREDWLAIGMALHWAGHITNKELYAKNMWDTWSSKSEDKYQGKHDINTVWRSFTAKKGVKLGTFFHIAAKYKWTRKLITADELFSSTKDTPAKSPLDVINNVSYRPPSIDMRLFPKLLQTRVNEVSEHVGCDPLVPLFAGLSTVCAVMNAESRLELMPGYKVPPILWFMTIGNPADKKTPGSRPMMSILRDIEYEHHDDYRQQLLDWEGIEANWSAAKRAYLTWCADPENMLGNSEAPVVPELPPQPVSLKITVSDITSQKLVRHAAERPRGLLCYLDEMSSWVKKIVGKTSPEDRSTWTVSYEGQSYEMDRVGDGSIYCSNLAVSIYGNIQPKVLSEGLNLLETDGLLQRFIPAVLRPEFTKVGNPVPSFLTSEDQWNNRLRMIFSLPVQDYVLSKTAHKYFREFQHWYEKTKKEEMMINSSDAFMTAFGKLEGTVGRLAFILHLIERPMNNEVNCKSMIRAIEIVKTFIIPSYRYAFENLGSDENFEKWFIGHIISRSSTTVKLHELKRQAAKKINGSDWVVTNKIIEVMGYLEEMNWVKTNVSTDSSRTWSINPQLFTVYQEYRDKIIQLNKERRGL
jgi:hypothetical protein